MAVLKTESLMNTEFKGTKGDFKEDLGIDLLGHNDELMQIIIFSKEVNTHNVAHVFGLSQEEVMANAKLFAKSKEMLEMQSFISETDDVNEEEIMIPDTFVKEKS